MARILEDNAIIRIDANNIEKSASQPQFKSLLDLGWKVVATIPVDDQGKPTIICIMHPPTTHKKSEISLKYLEVICTIQTIAVFLVLYYLGR